jgi:regulator of protease activity HflC (stomatin/prohibitin superfamily)
VSWLSTVLQAMSRPLKWWVVVASWEQGVRVRFGRNPKRLDPGIHFRIPFVDRIYVQSTRTRIVMSGNQSVSTEDGKIYTVGLVVRFRIQNIVELYESLAQPEQILMCDALGRASQYISTTHSEEISPAALQDAVNEGMLEYGCGLEEVQARIIGFCQSRCYRMITGESWVPYGKNLDDKEYSGEK